MKASLRSLLLRFCVSIQAPKWLAWATINLSIAAYYLVALFSPESTNKTAWLPGETTHGHYQIEMKCDACHDPSKNSADLDASDDMQDACIQCHGAQLDLANDTHPAKKFRDPTNAERLKVLNAQDCLTCHQEHVPEQTRTMGLTVPSDYCWHCHQEIGETRPSHLGMAYDSCATVGCHNYHDNRALYEKFLDGHFDQPDHLAVAVLPARNTAAQLSGLFRPQSILRSADADHPQELNVAKDIIDDWQQTAHATAGVNCSHCHGGQQQDSSGWDSRVAIDRCAECHAKQRDRFLTGKHGMRLASGLSPMTPQQARLAMHAGAAHQELNCNACHDGHRFDTSYAATEACLGCHADEHSQMYSQSSHASLWRAEVSGGAQPGTGVSCATCHLPRSQDESGIWVDHDQNANLRPNETMAREVCLHCHGLEYSLSALASSESLANCFSEPPSQRIHSVQMAHEWFLQRTSKTKSHSRP